MRDALELAHVSGCLPTRRISVGVRQASWIGEYLKAKTTAHRHFGHKVDLYLLF